MQETFQLAVARACRLSGVARATWYRKNTARDQAALRLRIRELAMARPRFGYLRIHVLLEPRSAATYSRVFRRFGPYTARHWQAIARLCLHAQVAACRSGLPGATRPGTSRCHTSP
jgi:putative transposase